MMRVNPNTRDVALLVLCLEGVRLFLALWRDRNQIVVGKPTLVTDFSILSLL